MKHNGILAAFATLFLLVCWQLASILLQRAFLPTPMASFIAFYQLLREGVLLPHFLISGYRILVSGLLALAMAVPLGLMMGRYPLVDRLFSPLVAVLYPLPKVVFLPILVVVMGLGNLPKIVLIAMIIFFQILVVVRDAVHSIAPEYFVSMRSLSTDPWMTFRHLVIPCILPDILTSLRVSVGTAIAVLFFAETFASFDGLGYLILDGMESRDYADMYAGIIGMALLGVVLYQGIAILERRLCRWRKPTDLA